MDDKSSIWARTTTLQQCGIFLAVFAAAALLFWVDTRSL